MVTTKGQFPVSARARQGAALRRAAFTLVELMIVVAILLLLVGILTPSFQGVGKRATAVRCAANLHQIGIAFAKRKAEGGQGYYPTGQEWPSAPYGNCRQPAVFACPSIGDVMGEGEKPDAATILKNTIYYCRNRGFYIVLNDPGVQGYGHQHAAVLQSTGPEGKIIEFAVEDVDPPVTSITAQGDDGAVHITLDTFPATATLIDGGCGEHNCLLYYGKPMFPQRSTGPIDPKEWHDPASVGTNGYYGYTGYDRRKIGQVVSLDGLRCDYGINRDAYRMAAGESKVVVTDFDENSITWDAADINTKLVKVSDRHGGTINALRAGGAVDNMTPAALNPQMPGVADAIWKP